MLGNKAETEGAILGNRRIKIRFKVRRERRSREQEEQVVFCSSGGTKVPLPKDVCLILIVSVEVANLCTNRSSPPGASIFHILSICL